MSLTLTVLLSLLSAGVLAGRVYEILNLTDSATGFLLVGGIILNPYILALFVVITLCCGIIIFSQYKITEPYYSHTSKYTAFIAGLTMTVSGILSLPYKSTAPFFIAGGLAILVIAAAGIGKKKSDYIVMILLIVFAAGLCMDVVSFDVLTYHNTQFLCKVLSYICMTAFMLVVVKSVYMPSRWSRMFIYVTGVISFAVCSMMSLADIICYIIQGGQSLVYLVMKIAVALFGVYAYDNAVSAIPDKKDLKRSKKEEGKINSPEFEIKSKNTEEKANTEASEEKQSVVEKEDITLNSETENIFAGKELEQIFDAFAEEKSVADSKEKTVYSSLAEEFVLKEHAEKPSRYEMFTEVFGAETKNEISAPQEQGIFGDTRSFKKFAAPKLDETAPEYDMLKSMFRGEDTSQYDVPEAEDAENRKKRSIFGRKKDKKAEEKSVIQKDVAEDSVVSKPTDTENKKPFVSGKPKTQKEKNEIKKTVYKKPK